MELRIFRFFQFIELILSNFVVRKEICAKIRAATISFASEVATPDRKEIGYFACKGGVNFIPRFPISNLFFKKKDFSRNPSPGFGNGIFFLFVGFVIGNLFGTFLPAIRIVFSWDGFIVLFLLFFIEFISYIRYQRKSRFFLILWDFRARGEGTRFGKDKGKISFELKDSTSVARQGKIPSTEELLPLSSKVYKSLNYFKIGFLLGFFIDAYKVGS